jgi:ABC-type transporter Mla maintaining outer membrane lipid asymmetry ATPase subunit MlaF
MRTTRRNIRRGVIGRQYILDDVSFEVPERSITCIMGVSGTGKTTLLRLVAGLLKPDSGEILVNGRDVVLMSEKELNEVRREMGFVFPIRCAVRFDEHRRKRRFRLATAATPAR